MQGDSSRWPSIRNNLVFYLILVALAFIFFAPVRDNTFWHPGDYLYMLQALRIETDWRQVFAQAPQHTFQPLVNFLFFLEFQWFELDAWQYYLFNIVVHAFNAWLVYCLVRTLLRERAIAVLSSLLFVFAVGNYGKAVMVVSGISDLVITALTLLTMIFYIRNELDERGQLWTGNFLLTLLFFAASLLSKATSFSILGCMVAFNLFFREQTGRRVFDRNILIIAGFALAVLVTKIAVLKSVPGAGDLAVFSTSFPRNFASYLVRMVFPIQQSTLVSDAGALVRFVYRIATEIRIVTFLCIVSYSVFGFIFGNKVIRFFIAWTYITVAPFCFFRFPSDWLNIRYLYLVSVGFSMILASGTVLAARLLYQKPWRRRLPYLIPVTFVLLSQFVIQQLDHKYAELVRSPRLSRVRIDFTLAFQERNERRAREREMRDEVRESPEGQNR
jgi:hypothetical protein